VPTRNLTSRHLDHASPGEEARDASADPRAPSAAAPENAPATDRVPDPYQMLLREREELLGELEEAYRELARLLARPGRQAPRTAVASHESADSLEQANERLREAREELVRGERLMTMGEMAAEIGHEINNYLSVIGGRAELIGRALDRGDTERARRFAAVVCEKVEQVSRLTRSLLDFSRQRTERRLEDPAVIVVEAVQLLGLHARRARVALNAGCPGGLPHIHADRAQMEQVLVNLIKNGIEAVAGRPEGRVHVAVSHDRTNDALRFEVQDNGPGIPADLREELLKPHFTSKEGGHGFGLTVANRVVRNHGGRLEFETVEGGGTTFFFSVPVHPLTDGGQPLASKAGHAGASSASCS
jgi:C4-dicarboxylate-specific signal transduction histidine kinase